MSGSAHRPAHINGENCCRSPGATGSRGFLFVVGRSVGTRYTRARTGAQFSLASRWLKDLNTVAVGLANNHVKDLGEAGFSASPGVWTRAGIVTLCDGCAVVARIAARIRDDVAPLEAVRGPSQGRQIASWRQRRGRRLSKPARARPGVVPQARRLRLDRRAPQPADQRRLRVCFIMPISLSNGGWARSPL